MIIALLEMKEGEPEEAPAGPGKVSHVPVLHERHRSPDGVELGEVQLYLGLGFHVEDQVPVGPVRCLVGKVVSRPAAGHERSSHDQDQVPGGASSSGSRPERLPMAEIWIRSCLECRRPPYFVTAA
jgi:hypothetical protein